MMPAAPNDIADLRDPEVPEHTLRNFVIALPFLLAVPVLLLQAFPLVDGVIQWEACGVGALGWLAALMLRGPVSVLALRLKGSPEAAQPWVIASSGPLEEGVRLAALFIVGTSFSTALSLGLGWAAIEVLFTIVNGAVVVSLVRRDDEQARAVRRQLAAQGLLTANGPFWGVLERLFASAAHIGHTLLLAWQPLLVLVTTPVHSFINVGVTKLTSKSLSKTELLLAVIGTAVLAAGLAAFGRL